MTATGKPRSAKPRKGSARKTVAVVDPNELTDKQRLFIEQYFVCGLNATEAALAVYDTTDREVAASIGGENLRKPQIRERINDRLDEWHMGANEVLARMSFHARGSMEEFVDADSLTIDLKKAKAAKKLGLIKRLRTKFTTFTDKDGGESETVEIEIELYDAQASLRDLGKHWGLFAADQNINFNFNQLSDEALRDLAAGRKPREIEMPK